MSAKNQNITLDNLSANTKAILKSILLLTLQREKLKKQIQSLVLQHYAVSDNLRDRVKRKTIVDLIQKELRIFATPKNNDIIISALKELKCPMRYWNGYRMFCGLVKI